MSSRRRRSPRCFPGCTPQMIGASSCFCSSRFPRDTLSQAGHGTVLESSPFFLRPPSPMTPSRRGAFHGVLERSSRELAMMKSGSSVLRAIWVGREEGVVQVATGRPASLFVPPEFLDLLPCWFPPRRPPPPAAPPRPPCVAPCRCPSLVARASRGSGIGRIKESQAIMIRPIRLKRPSSYRIQSRGSSYPYDT